jgi:DNA modification methylase
LGLEPTPEEYVANLVAVFREVRRVLRDDGVVFLNLGDSYAGSTMTGGNNGINSQGTYKKERQFSKSKRMERGNGRWGGGNIPAPDGLKPKDLIGIPWRVAFALQADGWWLRSDIIWAKPNPMPESVTDRPTKAHEYVFLLTKSQRY